MGRRWEQFKLDWEQGLHRLPFFTQRTAVALLGVLVATLALLGGLATIVRTPSRHYQGAPGEIGGAATTLPSTAPGGVGAGAGQPATGQPGGGAGGAGPGGGSGPGGGEPGTPGAAPVTTTPGGGGGGGGGGGAPTTTTGGLPGSTTTTTSGGGGGGGLPPVTVTVTVTLPLPLPLPLIGAHADVSLPGHAQA